MSTTDAYLDTIIGLDIDYVRELGNDLRAQLFLDPRGDGQAVYPLPVAIEYHPSEDITLHILAVLARTVRTIGGVHNEALKHEVIFTIARPASSDASVLRINAPFGQPLTVSAQDIQKMTGRDERETGAIVALLRAFAGTDIV